MEDSVAQNANAADAISISTGIPTTQMDLSCSILQDFGDEHPLQARRASVEARGT
jgi:hypothetical protein